MIHEKSIPKNFLGFGDRVSLVATEKNPNEYLFIDPCIIMYQYNKYSSSPHADAIFQWYKPLYHDVSRCIIPY